MDLSYRVLAPLFMDIAVIFLLVGMIMNTGIFRKRGRTDDRLFFLLLVIDALVAACDAAGYYVDGKHFPGANALNLLFLNLYYMLLLLFAYVWVLYLDHRLYGSEERTKKAAKLLLVPVALFELLYIVGIPGKWFFFVDGSNRYGYGPGYIYPVLVAVVYGVAGLFLNLMHERQTGKAGKVPTVMLLVPVVVALVVSYAFGGVSMVSESLAAMLTYLHSGSMNETFHGRRDCDVQ